MRAARFTVAILAACLLLASTGDTHAQKPAPSKADIEKAKRHYAQGRDHQDNGKFEEAAKQYLAAYELYPDAEFLFNVGEVYRLNGDKRRAVEYFEKYLELDPNGRGSGDARASLAALEKEIAAEEAEAARKKAAEEEAARRRAEEDAAREHVTDTGAVPDQNADQPAAPASEADPSASVLRPLQLAKGQVAASADVQVFTAPNNDWEAALGSWIGLAPGVSYGVSDTIQVGAQALLLPLKPSSSDFEDAELFGAMTIGGQYLLHDLVSARLDLGVGLRGRLMSNPYTPPLYPSPLYSDLTFGFRAGVSVKKAFAGKVALSADPTLVVQLDSTKDHDAGCSEEDPECVKAATALHLPLAAHYQATPMIAVGLRTGIYTGSELQLGSDEGASIPLLAECLVVLGGGQFDAGLQLGTSNLTRPDDGPELGETLYVGLHAAWRNR